MIKQLSLTKDPRKNTKLWWIAKQKNYGGSLDYRKVERPFDSKKSLHVVFKAQLGRGIWFTQSQKSISGLILKVSQRYGVKVNHFAINKDHIHLLVTAKYREDFIHFLRLFSAEMGRKYKSIFQRFGINKTNNLWIHRPFTRLVSRGRRSFQIVRKYIERNRQEALGFIEYKPRMHRLSLFLEKWNLQKLIISSTA